ncbi:uncharacterized protein BT62DRAFT_1010746 [Guyanagaster necrorhizus]|uniref:Uncharacterized protein n=1 Tax=Guyanagaster necrorhizus TaxID=856835 RepID=A0A9P7VK61_9AGAR|nr:uncharacterized protein BT62DRAFT_1010746 [Guyanagaster necrorhizus MCA 3950]KAG7442209.1 hypothetical protein BT62DRAFT_1010746 [Guyanagaster necrorhizus MCA 3950]
MTSRRNGGSIGYRAHKVYHLPKSPARPHIRSNPPRIHRHDHDPFSFDSSAYCTANRSNAALLTESSLSAPSVLETLRYDFPSSSTESEEKGGDDAVRVRGNGRGVEFLDKKVLCRFGDGGVRDDVDVGDRADAFEWSGTTNGGYDGGVGVDLERLRKGIVMFNLEVVNRPTVYLSLEYWCTINSDLPVTNSVSAIAGF